jgi:hypothetical protein
MPTVLQLAAMYAAHNGSTYTAAARATDGMPTAAYNNLQAWLERAGLNAGFAALAYGMPSPAYALQGLRHLRAYVG